MTAYMVVTVDTTDPAWVRDYRNRVPALIEKAGGRYLAFSRAPEQWEGEGDPPGTMAILEFPSLDAARTFFDSDEYRPFAESRRAGARTTIRLAEGVPDGPSNDW